MQKQKDSNPRSRMAADLQSAFVAAGEHLIILWNLVESRSNSVRFALQRTTKADFQSCAYTKSAKVPICGSRRIRARPIVALLAKNLRNLSVLHVLALASVSFVAERAACRLPLGHTSIGFRVQRYNTPMQPFCVTRKIFIFL